LAEVKKLHIGPLSLRTKVMRELRQLKDLRHENVNTFIGLYIDQNEPALVFEYGNRGSLEVRNLCNRNSIQMKEIFLGYSEKRRNQT
jgi:serine/threonine protein kinase